MPKSWAYLEALACACVLWILIKKLSKTSKYPLPPGPPGEPILGHLRVVPVGNPELQYREWSRQYGDVLYFHILGQPIIVLNSVKAAIDLLDKRGSNYCDRPAFHLFEEMGWEGTLTFLRWGPRFQRNRKLIQSSFTKPQIVKYQELQMREARVLVRNLMKCPEDYDRLIRRFATAIVMDIAFGHEIKSDADLFIQIAADASYALGHGGAPAGTTVKYLPNCLSFLSRSLQFARNWKWAIRKVHDIPFAAVETQIKEGNARPSITQSFLDRLAANAEKGIQDDLKREDVKGAAGAIYAAGQDTTWSTIVVFLVNVIFHPEIVAKAQAELDAVVGSDRLPTFTDRLNLPYIDRIVQETFRSYPVSPIGVPHKSLEDDVYRDMFIPKGSFVIANAYSMCHDETVYKDHEVFNPDRYAPISEGGHGEPFPLGQFGFGRRICPGRHLGDASVFIVIATMLHTLDIGRRVDARGEFINPVVKHTAGLTCHPEMFECSIRARSRQMEELVCNATL
ncbi:cytochrome P450 [Desarmillaria tabescens]|uniref:Cytochrome P450 n=1 Tax=Armillaria tabescens TaxID=1929756 RepID=A0AA39K866_ARMTA|nr:cytochrome P450 [Desarmillaria tabescens]KAK0455205.1 cytochrome P450 [Desarmillaria tabescens]